MVDDVVIIEGHLYAHYVQGYEGTFDCAVLDYQHHISNCKNYDHMYFLKDGDYLTILTAKKELIWEGEIKFVRPGVFDGFFSSTPRLHKVWLELKQKGVDHQLWINWFWEHPPLHAVLKRRVSDELDK